MNVLVIDNYDSFVYNIAQYLGELGSNPTVIRNDKISIDKVLYGMIMNVVMRQLSD